VVLAGSEAAIDRALALAAERGYISELLRWDRAYHTPLYAPYADVVREQMTTWIVDVPRVPLYSCTTTAAYPADLDEVRRISHEHWMQPVEFRRTIETMYADGIRLFVEVGPRANLTAFVDDILRGQPYAAVPCDVPRRSSVTQLNHLVGLLAAHAVPMRLEPLYARRAPRELDLESPADPLHETKRPGIAVRLATGWPQIEISDEILARLRDRSADPVSAVPNGKHANGHASVETDDLSDASERSIVGTSFAKPTQDNGQSDRAPDSKLATVPAQPGPPPAAREPTLASPGSSEPIGLSQVQPQAAPAQHPAAAATPTRQPAAADVSQVMSSYLRTMEQFLAVQQEVTQAYLERRGQARPSGLATPPLHVPATTQLMPAASPVAEPHPAVAAAVTPELPAAAPAAESSAQQATSRPPAPDVDEALDAGGLSELLLRIVGDKTGYPADMLDPGLDLEADLGIDSIKRVEILGAFQQQSGIRLGDHMEALSTRKTFQDMVDLLLEHVAAERLEPGGTTDRSDGLSPLTEVLPDFPFIQAVVTHTPGAELVARCDVSLQNQPFLRDHSLGRDVSLADPELTGLPVMPLTMSMEMLAQAGSALMPGWCLVGMKEVRAYRWIALDNEAITLQLTARRTLPEREVFVQIHEVSAADGPEGSPSPPIVEGMMVFAQEYPEAPVAENLALQTERPGKWPSDQLYGAAMFHGPAFQGVQTVDRVGDDGAEATLVTLPLEGLFPPDIQPNFATDPVLLDQPGQVVGFWAAQLLEKGYLVFPFRLEALHFYGSLLPPHEQVACRARIAMIGDEQVRSDLGVVRADGRVHVRFEGWWDRRFDLPRPFYRLLLSPEEAALGQPWLALEPLLPDADRLQIFRQSLDIFPDGLLTGHGGIWRRVLAHLVLSRRELELWRSLRMPEGRRLEWLLGRLVAKDAARNYLKQRYGLVLNAADVEILPDANGKPLLQGAWTVEVAAVPVLSLAHAGGTAVAVLGDPELVAGVGVDIEFVGRMTGEVEQVAFTTDERALLAKLPEAQPQEWALRCWCAKEAVAKALGHGMAGGPQALVVQVIDTQSGTVQIGLAGELLRRLPWAEATTFTALTAHEGDLIVAVSTCERMEAYDEKP
jgi:phosphopantetheine--protein transferase-like protein